MPNLWQNGTYEFEDFRLDVGKKLLYRAGEQISLTPRAVETLLALVERQGEVVGKDELMKAIWGETIVEESNLTQYLYLLRKTLGVTCDGKSFIETLKRRGYRFNGKAVQTEFASSTSASPVTSATALATDAGAFNQIADPHLGPTTIRFRNGFLGVAIFSGVFLLAAFSFGWFKPLVGPANQSAKSDLTILALTNGETVDKAAISPDSKYFAYTALDADTSHLWLQQVGDTSRIEILSPFRGRIQNLSFTPDSSSIYFVASKAGERLSSLYRIPTLGGVPAKILTNIGHAVSFSPDGTEIVFVREDIETNQSQIVIASSDGTRERKLLTRDGLVNRMQNAAWKPDGKSISFGLIDLQARPLIVCTIVGIDLATSAIKQLSPEKWDTCHRSAWTSDGKSLIFVGTKYEEASTTRRDQIYYLNVENGESRRLTTDGNWHETETLGVTNSNEILALPFNRVSQIWSLNADGDSRTARQITNGQSDGRGGIVALPNGRIQFLSRAGEGFGIFQTSDDGSETRKQIAVDPTMEEPRAGTDGSFLVFTAKRDGYSQIFRIDPDGANRQQLTFDQSHKIDSTVSPDGQWIVYAASGLEGEKYRYRLEKIPATGGEPLELLNEQCDTPHFSPDGRLISCIEGQKIRVLSFEGGETLNRFQTMEYPILNSGARWSPDGKNLIYRVSQKTVTNLWQQPVDGGKPNPLTNFTNGEIYNFVYALDGTRLYIARGNQIRNAILVKGFK